MGDTSKPSLIDVLTPSISSDRLATYLQAAGFVGDRALKLYLWNATIGEAFHLPIQAVEVGLRNRINTALCIEFGPDWWQSKIFLDLLSHEQLTALMTVERRMVGRAKPVVTPQIVASLSIGFWVGMLNRRFNPTIWSRHLHVAFVHLPGDKNLRSIEASARRTAALRNRIWHHEPVFRSDLSAEFSSIMELLIWVCPAKANWIRPHCRVLSLLRQKP
jgi:hypothetical protein